MQFVECIRLVIIDFGIVLWLGRTIEAPLRFVA